MAHSSPGTSDCCQKKHEENYVQKSSTSNSVCWGGGLVAYSKSNLQNSPKIDELPESGNQRTTKGYVSQYCMIASLLFYKSFVTMTCLLKCLAGILLIGTTFHLS
ncbi:hypothetical protein L2E82_27009 [Cichorium intybus]|uniref:Uncharacterized protein n=1 Tax=Cichorium intybus TaxID=13427 RepID=A0ACB9CS24_CICIN|nr:hypothetical protein L2E82_27009 [Cichorium intybus]